MGGCKRDIVSSQGVSSKPVKQRLNKILDLLSSLRHVDQVGKGPGVICMTASQTLHLLSSQEPAGAGRGIWLGPALWKEVIRQLESQVSAERAESSWPCGPHAAWA